MANLAQGKPTTASSYVLPYSPNRAVNGVVTDPTSRWVCNSLPGYLQVDLGAMYWINRWVMRGMPVAGWIAPNYTLSGFQLQISKDGGMWTTVDSVVNNTLSIADRTISSVQCRYVRLCVPPGQGINCNKQLASVMELEVYEAPPTSSLLNSLVLSQGELTPMFASNITSYTATVDMDVAYITMVPTSIDGGTITIKGIAVVSGMTSEPIMLELGANTIPIVVTSRIGGLTTTYNIVVTRQDKSAYLSNMVVKSGLTTMTLNPAFVSKNLGYSVTCKTTQKTLTITPTAADTTAAITVNGTTVQSGKASSAITITNGMIILISVTVENSNTGRISKIYSVTITIGQ